MTKLDKAQTAYDAMTDPFYESLGRCPECGGNMVGDGYTEVVHCEFADEDDYLDHEPDTDPVYCKESDHE